MPNRLAHETSPYLLQHKDNPVDWYPWGKEAIERAKAENKPILLSVGYSACHWCHVMEHESFENPEIAQVMNQKFINIKVDREERPDLDHVYQNVVQAISMGGGWPLTVFLTPELKPFFGGTYFPPEDRWGRPGFPRVLTALSEAYLSDQESVARNIESLMDYLSHMERIPSLGASTPTQERLGEIAQEVLQAMDLTKGGLAGAPKFPNSMLLTFLWREGKSQGIPHAQEAALLSLEKMASGGIYDQLGGGFHRYSVDDSWSVPHFEKMLYDNGLLLKLYSEVLLKDGKPPFAVDPVRKELFLRVIEETTQYVLSEMTSPEGGFFSAQDADTEGEEGKFFAWECAEVERVLEPQEAKAFTLRYGVSAEGNFEHGKNVLHLALSIADVAAKIGESEGQVRALIDSARAKLKREREKRVKPATDHKVIASWNGLMISGLAWASQALRAAGRGESARKAWEGATRAFEFVKKNHAQSPSDGRDSGARLWSTGKLNGYLDDYAFLAMAALDLARFEEIERSVRDRMGIAEKWCESVIAHFSDPESAGYYFTSDDHEALIQRPKTLFDQAIPAGTSVAIHCMMALSEMGSAETAGKFSKEVEKQLPDLFPLASRSAQGCAELLNAASLWIEGPRVLSGPDTAPLVLDPAVFRKASDPGAEGNRLVCHRGVCQTISS